MATINQGILGGFSGSVGTVIGGSWNGIDYMRGRKNDRKDAKSMAQLDQRARFKTIVKYLKPLKSFLPVGFKNRKAGLSAYNAASSCNIHSALTGVYPDYTIDYSKLKVSCGSLPGALNPSVVVDSQDRLLFSWENNSSELYAMANDKVVLVVLDPTKGNAVTFVGGNSRSAGNHIFALPDGFGKENLQCYIAFRNISQTNISDSQYVGSVSL